MDPYTNEILMQYTLEPWTKLLCEMFGAVGSMFASILTGRN